MVAVCLIDTLLTIVLIARGLAEEANPLMAWCLGHGYTAFCLAKVASVLPAVVAAEWYSRRNPTFSKRVLRAGTGAYVFLYFALLAAVNLA